MPGDDERGAQESPGSTPPAGPGHEQRSPCVAVPPDVPGPLPAEIDRIRPFGEIRRFAAGEFLFHAGETMLGTYVILVRPVAIVPRDVLGQEMPVGAFAQLLGVPLEEMSEVVPGEVMADLGQLSGRQDVSAIDAQAVGDVEAIALQSGSLRALLIAEAELGERILRALILRRVALIEMGFGGPVLIWPARSPDMTRLSVLERSWLHPRGRTRRTPTPRCCRAFAADAESSLAVRWTEGSESDEEDLARAGFPWPRVPSSPTTS
jgi:hypothetical protein